MKCPACNMSIEDSFNVCPICGTTITQSDKDNYHENLKQIEESYKKSLEEYNQRLKGEYKQEKSQVKQVFVPKCPTCGSTNIERIGMLDRAVSIGILGIFSNKINKSYKCRNCKATW